MDIICLNPRAIERGLHWIFYKTEMKIWAVGCGLGWTVLKKGLGKVHNKQSIIVFLFFEVYNVNYKGELTSLFVGFSKKSKSHLSVLLRSSKNGRRGRYVTWRENSNLP